MVRSGIVAMAIAVSTFGNDVITGEHHGQLE